MKCSIALLLFFVPIISMAQTLEEFNYPMNGGKIGIESSLEVNQNSNILFKRVQEFFAVHNFDKSITVKTKSDNIALIKIIDKPILYQDAEIGKVIGQCWLPLSWNKHNYTFVVFKVEINISQNTVKYSFSNFKAIDILDAPKTKSAAIGGVLFSASAGSSSPTISREYPLEDYMTKVRFPSKWLIKSDNHGQTLKNELINFEQDFIKTIENN